MIKIQTVKFGTSVELAGKVYTTADIRVKQYQITEMNYNEGLLEIKIEHRVFLVPSANIAFMEPVDAKWWNDKDITMVGAVISPVVGKIIKKGLKN